MKLLTLAPILLAVGGAGHCAAAPMFYTNEAAFREAITALGYNWFAEGFEGPEWEASRYPGTTSDVVSQGVIWYAETRVATYSGKWNRTGNYGVFDTTWDSHNAPSDHVYAAAPDLTAIGGWFQGIGTLRVSSVSNHQSVTLGTLVLGAPFRFAGVVDAAGLIDVEFGGAQFCGDDFIIALVRQPPAPPKVSLVGFSKDQGAPLFIQGQRNRTNVIEASEDLVAWTRIATNVMPEAVCDNCPSSFFSDVAVTNAPRRFYRAFQLP